MNNIELVIFDMDGLMFDTEVVSERAWYEAAKIHGYEVKRELFLSFIGMNVKSIGEKFKSVYGEEFPFEDVNRYHKGRMDSLLEEEGLRNKKGLIELLDYLDEKKIRKAVATSTSRERATRLLSEGSVLERFDAVICGDEVKKGKPDPEIFLKACSKLGVNTENAVVLEDSERGLLAASAGNIKCIVIPDLGKPSEENKGLAYSIEDSLYDVINLIK
ncbi:MAG: HAD family phosphatase [Clostridiaceae bacterium]